ncbi:hypothetical protein OQA88_10895 [Cercophora sp. LCS_1]
MNSVVEHSPTLTARENNLCKVVAGLFGAPTTASRPVSDAGHGSDHLDSEELESLKRYMYGTTPVRQAFEKSLAVFTQNELYENRVLVLVSDGMSTDGHPSELGHQLKQKGVRIATVYLTDQRQDLDRRLYYEEDSDWNDGQLALFRLAARVSALDEFCTLLLSARFGAADSLLGIVGRYRQDTSANDEQVLTCNDPSNQEDSKTCYAHAVAPVIHMSLLRIVGRDGGPLDVKTIRERILNEYPPKEDGRNVIEVLKTAIQWYGPLRFKRADENGARQAVYRRRPVLAAFWLSKPGWREFSKHFKRHPPYSEGSPILPVLTHAEMRSHRSSPTGGGHAVVLTGCNPTSLTFLNSWGRLEWGNKGSFSVEDHTVLEVDPHDLTSTERQAFDDKVEEKLSCCLGERPEPWNLEAQCPHCRQNAPILEFTGNVRSARCPLCCRDFSPETQHLLECSW